MNNGFRNRLTDFYKRENIYPENFQCKNAGYCKAFAYKKIMTEAKMSMVGSKYGERYPRIVVISLDPPSGENGDFTLPNQRTSDYIATFTEAKNFSIEWRTPQWAMMEILVKDILALWGYQGQEGAAIVIESYAGRPIDNVSGYFAHVNLAKCSMNYPKRRQAPKQVHDICSRDYLKQEIDLLKPEILITQGQTTNQILGIMIQGIAVEEYDLPMSKMIIINGENTLWMPMHHPTQQLNKIRAEWHFYEDALKLWKEEM